MLTGFGGDECFEGSTTARMTDLAREGNLLELIRTAKAESTGSDAWRMIFDYGVRPNIPAAWKVPVRSIRRRPFHWLSPEFVRRTNLLDRIQPVPLKGATCVQEAMHSYFYAGFCAHFHESWDRTAALVGVEERHPFLDRRVAEFAFALPEEQRAHRGRSKIVLRKAMKGRLPIPVEERRLQTDFTPVMTAAVRVLWKQRPFPSDATLSCGWTVASEMAASLDRALDGNLKDIWRVWAAAGIDIWYSNSLRTSSRDVVWVGDRLSVKEGKSNGGSRH